MLVIGSVFSQIFRSVIGDVDWTPLSIFYGGEPGVWFDPSDLTTLFQDSAGITPVTAPGQTVGLMLDKSQGLALGSELWSDTGVTVGTGWTVASGVYTHTAGIDTFQKNIGLVTGKTYQVTFTVTGRTAGNIGPVYGGSVSGPTVTANGTYTQRVASGTNALLYFQPSIDFVGSVSGISVKLLAGNHATRSTLAQRPTYQIDSNGFTYLSFDGVDDSMVTPTITPGIGKAQAFSGVRKLSDATFQTIAETSTSPDASNGSLGFGSSTLTGDALRRTWSFGSRGTNFQIAGSGIFAAPISSVLGGVGDIAADTSILRVNGSQVASNINDQGAGNYLAYPLYIGRRAAASNAFNGRLYSLIVRFGDNLASNQITSAENWVNSKTGAY
jgi:hypothetical protein